ncbi:MAG: prepilin peptidase [Candidatus Aminicenantes bacterium]|nr:prepilin peptidase [Candidatus Aminicenantes bacterium]
MEAALVVVFGLIIGSFLNVVIHRLPLGENVVFPPSHCPHCRANIPFYYNIPVCSYLFLRGRCHSCRSPISIQYPLVEGFCAFSFWLTWQFFGLSTTAIFSVVFISLLITLAVIDLKHMILPDELTLGGSALFFTYSFFNPAVSQLDAVLSGLGAALVFSGFFYFYLKVRKIEGLGFGDVKMVLLMGLFLGLQRLVVAIFLASFSGLLVGLFFMVFKKKNLKFALPFGPFLSLGSYVSLFWGNDILAWLGTLWLLK